MLGLGLGLGPLDDDDEPSSERRVSRKPLKLAIANTAEGGVRARLVGGHGCSSSSSGEER